MLDGTLNRFSKVRRVLRLQDLVAFLLTPVLTFDLLSGQFTDPHIRQFNLIAIDNLGNGSTKGTIGDQRYTPKEVAEDLHCVLVSSKILCILFLNGV